MIDGDTIYVVKNGYVWCGSRCGVGRTLVLATRQLGNSLLYASASAVPVTANTRWVTADWDSTCKMFRRFMSSASSALQKSRAPLRVQTIQPLNEHKKTLIFMHGLGDTSFGFSQMFASDEYSLAMPQFKFVLPNAPNRSVTVNGGQVMPAWYDIRSLERGLADEDREGMLQSKEQIHAILDAECDLVGSKNVYVGGFSQGGAMAVLAAYTYNRTLGGVIAASGYVVMRDTFPDAMDPANLDTEVLAVHGVNDEVVPIKYAEMTFDDLSERCDVALRFIAVDDMGHEFPYDFEEDLVDFCDARAQISNEDFNQMPDAKM